MFHLFKFIIWIVGFVVVSGFVLEYFGYELNRNYFNEQKDGCQEKLKECQGELIHQGIDNAECDFNCVDPNSIIIKKK